MMKNQRPLLIVVILLTLLLAVVFLKDCGEGGPGGGDKGDGLNDDDPGKEKGGGQGNQPDNDKIGNLASATNIFTIPRPDTELSQVEDGGDFGTRVAREGGKSGDVQISLLWNTIDDVDLHCIDPNGEEIYFGARKSSSGGELDVDMNAGGQLSTEPVENVVWPLNQAPAGIYKVSVKFFDSRSSARSVPFKVRIKYKGIEKIHKGVLQFIKEKVEVSQFQVN